MNGHPESVFCIAVAQSSSVKGDITENVRHHAEFVSVAAEHGANVVLFPELSLTGYEPTIATESAIDADDSRLDLLQELSDRRNLSIIVGCPIRSHEAKPYIGVFIVRPQLPIETYRKRFVDTDELAWFIPSNDLVVCRCHTREVGIAICNDINIPVHAAETFQKGATIYTAGVAITPKGIGQAEANMSRYARDHMFPTAMANYASDTGGYSIAGRSAIWNECGEIIVQAPESGESLLIANATDEGWHGREVSNK